MVCTKTRERTRRSVGAILDARERSIKPWKEDRRVRRTDSLRSPRGTELGCVLCVVYTHAPRVRACLAPAYREGSKGVSDVSSRGVVVVVVVVGGRTLAQLLYQPDSFKGTAPAVPARTRESCVRAWIYERTLAF
jgi:hypothetical protein